jgi:hypothetical protein
VKIIKNPLFWSGTKNQVSSRGLAKAMRLTLYQPPKTIQLFNYYLLANLLIYMEKFSLIKVSGGDEIQ